MASAQPRWYSVFCDHNRSQALQWSTKSPNHLLTWTILNIILILIHLALAGDLGVSRWESWNISKIPASARWVDSGTGSATDCGRLWSGSAWGWTRHEWLLQENPQAGNWVLVWIYWIHVGFLREEGWDEIAKMILYKMSRFSMFCLLILLGCFLILWPITTNKMPSVGSSPTTRARICMNLLLVYIVLCVCVCESIRFVKMARGNVWLIMWMALLMPLRGFRQNRKLGAAWKKLKKTKCMEFSIFKTQTQNNSFFGV